MKLVVVNTSALHLGYVGCYGNDWVATPHLDRLAAEGIVFDQHYADNSTEKGPRTAWTGRFRFPLPADDQPIAEEGLTLDRLLQSAGISWVYLSDHDGKGEPPTAGGSALERVVDAAEAALANLASTERWLLWIDFPSLAPPWQVPEEFLAPYFAEEPEEGEGRLTPWTDLPAGPLDTNDDSSYERLQNTYAAAVTELDAQLGRLLDDLDQRRLTEEMLLCITGDRGLALGEHGVIGAGGPWLHEEIIHLPLIVRLPGGAGAGRRVFGLTQPVDLLPTFLEAFGLNAPPELHAHSLWPLLHGQAEQVRDYACAGERGGTQIEWALRAPEWAYILPMGVEPASSRGPQLYVKPDDRWEVNNVMQHHLDLAEHLERTLRNFVDASRRPGPLQPPELRPVEKDHLQEKGASQCQP